MSKIQGYVDPHKIISICSWCGRKIPRGSEIFSVGAKVKPNIDLHDPPSHAIQLLLEKRGKIVNAIVPTDNSQAKKKVMILCLQFAARNVEMH